VFVTIVSDKDEAKDLAGKLCPDAAVMVSGDGCAS
jgi:hypothetical protein